MRPIGLIRRIGLMFSVFAAFLVLNSTFAHPAGNEADSRAGLEEKVGNVIPPELVLYDEKGDMLRFRELSGRPAILTLVYYGCSHICPQLLGGLARALDGLQLEPGKDYSVITVSFDERDTSARAREVKVNYTTAVSRSLPDDAWRFLTADRENIREISDATGITFKRDSHGFDHPEVLLFLSPGGKITKYLHVDKYNYGVGYPVTFSKADLMTGLADASAGRTGPATGKTPLYCFNHKPERQEELFSILKISGGLMLLLLISLFIYLRRGRRA